MFDPEHLLKLLVRATKFNIEAAEIGAIYTVFFVRDFLRLDNGQNAKGSAVHFGDHIRVSVKADDGNEFVSKIYIKDVIEESVQYSKDNWLLWYF